MKFAYADPPYPGCAHLYKNEDSYGGEVDHAALVERLVSDYDGWALSTSSVALKLILPMCPKHTRVAAWVKPFAVYKPNVNPAYAWEPVLFHTPKKRGREQATVRDHISTNITLRKGLVGAKPKEFCVWIFNLLQMDADDEFHDLFPGTGIAMEMWDRFCGVHRTSDNQMILGL